MKSESALASVQLALNKKQAQVHELKTRLSNYAAKMCEYQKSTNAKDDLLKRFQDQLEHEKENSDSFKLKLEELRDEKHSWQEKFEKIKHEKALSERSKNEVLEALNTLTKENTVLNETHQRLMTDLKNSKIEIGHVSH